MNITGWTILAVLAIIAITVFYKKNKVWGTLCAGLVVGVIIAAIYLFQGNTFAWSMVLKGGIIGTLAGAILEWMTTLRRERNSQ